MKGMIKDALILFAITLIAGLMLGVVNDITKEPIAQQEQKAKNEACQNVFAAADSFEAQELADQGVKELILVAQETFAGRHMEICPGDLGSIG